MTGEEIAKYGFPERIDDQGKNVLAFRHESFDAAEAYALANIENHGHPSTVEWSPQEKAWLSLVDIQPAIDRLKTELDKNID